MTITTIGDIARVGAGDGGDQPPGYGVGVGTADRVATLFTPPPGVAEHPAVDAARRLGAELLEPHAAAADDPARGVRREHLDALTAAGLASVTVPVEVGGHGASDRVDVEVEELLAGTCGNTWFVLTQHELARSLASDPLAGFDPAAAVAGPGMDALREAVARGALLCGIAVNHVRRTGPPQVAASPDGSGGYRLTGRADWCTGWGLVDLVLLAGITPAERIVYGLVKAVERDGLRAGAPLGLAAMAGTRTIALELDGCPIAADEVALEVDADTWRRRDRARTVNTKPAAVGLLRRVLVAMEQLGRERDRPAATELALALAEHAVALRERAYALRGAPVTEHLAERAELRGRLAALAVRAANGLVAARSGSAMLTASVEQRWAREAMFHLVQAQIPEVRDAQLRAFGAGVPR